MVARNIPKRVSSELDSHRLTNTHNALTLKPGRRTRNRRLEQLLNDEDTHAVEQAHATRRWQNEPAIHGRRVATPTTLKNTARAKHRKDTDVTYVLDPTT